MSRYFTPLALILLWSILLSGSVPQAVAAPNAPLPKPENINCQGYESDTVVVRWKDTAEDETNYRVERKIGSGSWSEVATLSPNGEGKYEPYRDTGADVSSQNRFYRVRSYRSGDNSYSPYSDVCNNRRIFENDDFRIFYGLRGTSDACPQIDGQDVCLADDSSGGTNVYVDLQSDALQGSVAAFTRLGFTRDAGDHHELDRIPINVVWCDSGGCAGGGGLGLSPVLMETPFNLSTRVGDPVAWIVALHEAFHFQQFKYGGLDDPASAWVYEGQARSIQDKICIGEDRSDCEHFDDIATGYAGYVPEINAYLGNPNRPINQTAYQSALFWTYLTEKYGTSDPGDSVERGMDLIVDFWEESADTPGRDGIAVINSTLSNLGHSETFRDVWKDFAVANYAKHLSGPSVPARYQYADMSEPGGNYDPVDLALSESLSLGEQLVDTDETVKAWGAQYYEIRPASDVPILDIKFTQDSTGLLYYSVLGIKGDDLVYEFNVESRDLDHTLVNNAYDEVVVVVAGLENLANYRYSFNGTLPTLNILAPTTANKARVGEPASPDKFLVQVEVVAPDGTPLAGVDPGSFSFRIGTQNVPAGNILTSATVLNQQWFVIRATDQPTPGPSHPLYDLEVEYSGGTLSAAQSLAVDYTPRDDADNMLAIDRSGSMGSDGKLEAAQQAARLYVDSWRTGDMLGVVSFNANPILDMGLAGWTDSGPPTGGGTRQHALDAINALSAGGGTNIGDSIRMAWDELDNKGDSAHDWAIVLLSDGKEESSDPDETFNEIIGALEDTTGKRPVVHTVAVGPDADRPLMQRAATKTGGTYQFVSVPSSLMTTNGPAAIDNLELSLDSRYRMIATEVLGRQQNYSLVGPINDGIDEADTVPIPIESGAAELVLSLSWDPDSGLIDASSIALRDPSDQFIAPFQSDVRHRVWRVTNPPGGVWHLFLQTQIPQVRESERAEQVEFLPDYLIQAALVSDVTMDVYLTAPLEERTPGVPMQIVASLTDNGPITGASVIASVEKPGGAMVNLPLYDDGAHGDGAAGDGIYAHTFTQTGAPGSYGVTVTATGNSPLSGAFTRQKILSFHIDSTGDDDGDGLWNEWEIRFGLDPSVPDANQDPDNDGSSNTQEQDRGTDPNDSDTDDGGEADGTDTNPTDPSDDAVEPTWGVAYPGDGRVFVRFMLRPEYDVVGFFRGDNPEGPFNFHEEIFFPATSVYTDTLVTNGNTYCYVVLALVGGQRTAGLAPSCATPLADPYPPHGTVEINNGAATTLIPDVTLSLWASDSVDPHNELFDIEFLPSDDSASGVTEMMISNQADMAGGVWEPYGTSKPWTLDTTFGLATVYAKFRDAEGNESDLYPASIFVGAGPGVDNAFLPLLHR